ncbi:Uncharacterised protein [Acinetobacter baumannii]|uniref:hypothetical protein n=1 Tax=Acinetobacter baumannii TaxID=470 RepID=UPI000297E529|nr:hypothetical protein [Acinetobacter baumannii]EKP68428.1 hypothetical protein ACIN5035_1178 [Acinetobacter baumannii OIFC035]SSU96730.1 Uncharacterised protein [Acinetobacter baumannii]SSV56749.1 Uncharacterised protein [Acinetobacter baumannii]SSV60717.1 Uncharacterised protein [Acinetobacter baumannii]SSV88005.1 Uncharacterised protein [Acinetobacter baumannii]
MKLNKLSLVVFILFIFTGCGEIYSQPSDKYPFEVKMKALLGDNLKIVNSIRKAEVQISSFRFEKDPNKLKKVINQLEEDGWVLKGKGQGVDTYCLGRNNRINVVSPEKSRWYSRCKWTARYWEDNFTVRCYCDGYY